MVRLIAVNIARRKARTALTAAGIAVGVAAIVALLALSDGLNRTAGQLVHLGRADLGLFQKGASDPTTSALPLSLLPRVQAQPEVREVAPIQLLVDAVPQAPGAIFVGIGPDGFVARLLVVTAGRAAGPGHVLIGDMLARQLHLAPGATLRLSGRRFKVAGVFHSGITEEDTGVIMMLGDTQALAGRPSDEVTTFAVRLKPQVSAAQARVSCPRHSPSC